jgi:peptide/nickel transport system substrate-binding protein
MFRLALRGALGAGFMAAAMASASAQVLEIGADQGPTGLDPHLITAFPSVMVVNGNIYEGLTHVDKDLKVNPGLAESWTVAPDGKTYTFKLRANVKFHDGSAMEAEDVVSSIKRVQSKDIASPLASRLSAVESANAVDPQTVELKLKEPSAALLSSLATIAIVPSAMEANKDALQKTPVGTGPFKFQEWQPNGYILLARNEAYWEKGLPKLAGLKFNIVPESATRQVGLSNGQYALLPNTDAATALQLKGKPNVKLAETLDLAYTLIGMNVSKPPFDNAKVREALNYAINRKEIVDAALFGAGVPGGPLSPALKSWALDTKEFACYSHDPAKAQALLKEAGRRHAGCGDHERPAAPGHQGHRPGGAGAAQQGGVQGRAEEPGAGPVHPGLAQQQLRPVRLHQCGQSRSGRVFLPHLPHGRLHQRVQVHGPGDRRPPRSGPHHPGSGRPQDGL